MKRAMLEVVTTGVVMEPADVQQYIRCTLLAYMNSYKVGRQARKYLSCMDSAESILHSAALVERTIDLASSVHPADRCCDHRGCPSMAGKGGSCLCDLGQAHSGVGPRGNACLASLVGSPGSAWSYGPRICPCTPRHWKLVPLPHPNFDARCTPFPLHGNRRIAPPRLDTPPWSAAFPLSAAWQST